MVRVGRSPVLVQHMQIYLLPYILFESTVVKVLLTQLDMFGYYY